MNDIVLSAASKNNLILVKLFASLYSSILNLSSLYLKLRIVYSNMLK